METRAAVERGTRMWTVITLTVETVVGTGTRARTWTRAGTEMETRRERGVDGEKLGNPQHVVDAEYKMKRG